MAENVPKADDMTPMVMTNVHIDLCKNDTIKELDKKINK